MWKFRRRGRRATDWPRVVCCIGLAAGLAIAVAANLAYAIPKGPVVIGIGLVAPLVLPPVLIVRSLFTVNQWWQYGCRELAMLAVAGPAVAVSYWHTFSLVLAAGEPHAIAVLAPLSSDGLAGMCTLALAALAAGQTKGKGRPAGKDDGERAKAGLGAEKRWVSPSSPDPRVDAAAWARDNWPATVAQIQLGAGVSRRAATTARRRVAAERRAAS